MSKYVFLDDKRIGALADAAIVAGNSGIRSTFQFSVFLNCARMEGRCVADIFNLSSDTVEYKRHYTALRQLILGAANRDHNGANLLMWGENVYSLERAVLLTPKGLRLYKEIKSLLELT